MNEALLARFISHQLSAEENEKGEHTIRALRIDSPLSCSSSSNRGTSA
jgi:hypothetical protein